MNIIKKLDLNWKNFGMLNLGTFLVAVGVYFFRFPNNFSAGGVSGISVILSALIPNMSTGTIVWILNVVLLGLGFLVINGSFGIRTVYASMMFSLFIAVFEKFIPMSAPLTDQPLMELFFSVMIPAFGSALLFQIDASTGGSDITALILKRFTHMDIGKSLLCADFLVAASAAFVFDIKTGLFSILGLLVKALLVDSIMESFNICKYFNIVTSKPELTIDYVTHELNRSATEITGKGAYTEQDRTVLFVVLTRAQAIQLNMFLKKNDPGAFVTIINTSSIIGKGFKDRT